MEARIRPIVPGAGQLVLGRYRLLGQIARGGMSDVFLAAVQGRPDPVVVKRLRNRDDPQRLALFLDEVRVARRLRHPNLVRTEDAGVEGGYHFIIMEYLRGPTLRQLRRAARPRCGLPWAVEIAIARGVLEGLHHAHELRDADGTPLQIVHRDLSAQNVIVTMAGEAKVIDFGIAKSIDSLNQTQAGTCRGRMRNMPPEQIRGAILDRRGDVYAAAVMLWQGVSGQPLWGTQADAIVVAKLTRGEIPGLHELNPEVPPALREICTRALAPRPEDRHATAAEFEAALAAYVGEQGRPVAPSELAALVQDRTQNPQRVPHLPRSFAPSELGGSARDLSQSGDTGPHTPTAATRLRPSHSRAIVDPAERAPPSRRRLVVAASIGLLLLVLASRALRRLAGSPTAASLSTVPAAPPARIPTGAPEPARPGPTIRPPPIRARGPGPGVVKALTGKRGPRPVTRRLLDLRNPYGP